MRRVDAEGDSRGVQGRKRNETPYKSRLRQADLEWLEVREMLSTSTSTLPSPQIAVVTNPLTGPELGAGLGVSSATASLNLTGSPSAGTPSVAVDPLDANKMVAVWINTDPAGYNQGNFVAPITSYVEGAYSTDGGVTWSPFTAGGQADPFGGRSANVQTDFSLTVPTNGTRNVFTETTDASVAFDRNGNVYLLTSTHDAEAANGTSSAGVLDLQRFSFTSTDNAIPNNNGNGPAPILQTASPTVVFSWDGPDSGSVFGRPVTPVLAVDSNLASFTDPTTGATVTDPFTGDVYVVWASVDSNTFGGIPSFNPNTIRMATSNNQGVSFTAPAYVDNSSNANGYFQSPSTNPPSSGIIHDSIARYVSPQVTISQGSATVPGGQLSIVYDDYGSQAPADRIVVQTNTVGGTSQQFASTGTTQIAPNGATIPINVNITDPQFTTLQDFSIKTSIFWPNLSEIGAEVVPPTSVNAILTQKLGNSYPGFILLFNGDIAAQSGTADSSANLGVGSSGKAVGTVFDANAINSINDGNVKGGAVGFFRPTQASDGAAVLQALQGLTAAQLNGTWTFFASNDAADTSTSPKFVNDVVLNFSSGNNPGSTGPETTVADKFSLFASTDPGINSNNAASPAGTVINGFTVNGVYGTADSGSGNVVAPAQAQAILPQPVIASDNTLGSFSQYAGRIYVSFTGMFSNAQAGNTDIFLAWSDNGGKTWSSNAGVGSVEQVNSDNAATDGFSASTPGGSLGRTQYAPQIAVDQSTGAVVLSFLDARNDPANARVVTYIAASNDGGNTFAAETYANPSTTATDAITGATVILGPIPDNQSAAAGVSLSPVGYGIRQSLVVTDGSIIPFWASNGNTAAKLAIVNSFLTIPSGPRIISSTQGPVGGASDALNTARAADGTPIANTIQVTFDVPVDPAGTITALMSDTSVYYKSPNGGTSLLLPVTGVTAVNANALGATTFKITFDPSTVLTTFNTFVGTYSYVIAPTGIKDRISYTNASGIVVTGNLMDQNANGVSGDSPTNAKGRSSPPPFTNVGDDYVVGQPTNFASYATGTLPLIVPGPNVVSTQAVNLAGTVISSGTNNLVLNNTVGALNVTFDRNMQISSFTVAQILAIYGPAGAVPLTGITITPVSVYSNGSQIPYAGGAVADVFKISFTTQELSGTYSVTLASTILAADGSAMDANKNAGLDALQGIATNGNTVTVSYPSTATPSPITSGTVASPSVLMAPISVPDNFPIQNDAGTLPGLTLTLNITFPVDPTLIAYLLAPDGVTKINLFTKVGTGTNTANFSTTTFSDKATTLIDNAGAPFFGSFQPEAPLSNLAGTPSQGTWNLVIENIGSNTGTLNNWSLSFQKPVSTTNLGEVDDRSTLNFQIFNLAPSNALANSTWTAVGPTGITPTGATVPITYPAPLNQNVAILAGTAGTPSVLKSSINIPDNFFIQATDGVSLTLNIASLSDANLSAFLVAPNGMQIGLFANGLSGFSFADTTFSDSASLTIAASLAAGDTIAPYTGTFQPETPFSALATAGLNVEGTWTLVIQNNGAPVASLNNWSLTFNKPAATLAGAVSTIAVDPTDASGNTVYVGSATGGIWKTTNFLTTNPSGPTYQPLTDFGPNFSLNIGSIAAFGVNDNPSQTVLFAGTGFGQSATTATAGNPNVDLNAGGGVGILRSTDGGITWTLLDSLNNVDSSGNPLPESQRDHKFIGDTTYKIIVDPTPQLNGKIIVYAALGGPTGGLYRSLDSGNTWSLLSGGISNTCTDVILDPNSTSPTTGNLDVLYAAFPNAGVYISSNQGQTLSQMTGQLGKDPLLVNPGFPASPIAVGDSGVSPNGGSGTILLAKPALTHHVSEDIAYQGWLYAAVENANGTFQGLYVTKDNGENWTLVQLPNIPGGGSVKAAVPTNNNIDINSYDPTSSQFSTQGNYDLTLNVDPTNPNIVYIGGTSNFQQSGLIRVDLTQLKDAQNFTSFSNNQSDGGQLTVNSTGGVAVASPTNGPATYGTPPASNFLNLRYAPNNGTPGTSPFNINATLVLSNVAGVGFINNGTGATWSLFDEPLKANGGDPTGSTNLHNIVSYVDPITGAVRMIFANDMGVFTALVNPDGTLNNGIGTDVAVNYSRNGNLQNEQFFNSAAQPSSAASQAAGALFYASGQSTLAAQSSSTVLTSGNLTWDNSTVLNAPPGSTLGTTANQSISTSYRSGVGIATDATGGQTVYQFDVPILGGNLTDFFRVNNFGQTTGLVGNVGTEFPQQGTRTSGTTGNDLAGAVANGQIPLGNFAVNPLNGNQILIGSASGRLYETVNQGLQWLPIGNPSNFDGTQLSSIAFGAPDPNAPGGVGNLNNFIYVGTSGSVGGTKGHIYITEAGGQGWTDISSGLDGASIVGIYPDPNRGSHAAYAVTLTGVFYSSDTVALAASGGPVWTSITNNLTSIQYNPFGNSVYQQSVLAPFQSNSGAGSQGSTLYGGFSSILADYRYLIPAAGNTAGGANNVYYPVLYVSGYGGVFRSIDNGATWTVFPNTAFDAAPVDGGYLPSVDVTNLQLVLGNINPSTGHAVQTTGDPEVLLATTYGRGDFAIRLAPDVFPSTIQLDPTLPPPNGSDSGLVRGFPGVTNVLNPYIDGVSEVSNYGNTVTINIYDESGTTPVLIGTGTTNAFGQFTIQILAQNFNPTGAYYDPSFFVDGVKNIGIQATDSAGASGNVVKFSYTLKATPPAEPTGLTLTNDSGRSPTDNVTNLIPSTFTAVTTEPASTVVELVRAAYNPADKLFDGAFEVVGSVAAAPNVGGRVTLSDGLIVSELNGALVQTTATYYVIQIDLADNYSNSTLPNFNPATPLSNIAADPSNLSVFLNNTPPAAPTGLTLDPSTNSGTIPGNNITNSTAPLFDVTGLLTNPSPLGLYNLLLFRSLNGSTPIQVGTALPGVTQIRDTSGTIANGVNVYSYTVKQVDLAGNVSPANNTPLTVTINTTSPAVPTLQLYPPDDSGAPTHLDVTNVTTPRFNGTGTANLPIALYLYNTTTGQTTGSPLASTTVTPNGTYLFQITSPLADGVYTFVARITNAAGNSTNSTPLTVTIKATGPQVVPTLSLTAATDTGIIGDGVTANHNPQFTGTTDKGDLVTLYALINGVLTAESTATASAVNGSFLFSLPFSLTDGTTVLYARSTDIAGNQGPLSSPLNVRIISVAGDSIGNGKAQLSVFQPNNESYAIQSVGTFVVDSTPGRDVPVQYDFNGNGATDLVGYRFNAAQYYGTLIGNGSTVATYFGTPGVGLPISGYYGGYGTFIYATFDPNTDVWAIALPRPGGLVVQFGAAKFDVPVPAAYDGGGVTEIATFRPVNVAGGDADSFNVDSATGYYQISFTSPAVEKLGFTYKPGDIPAPADYAGVGHDQFAIYRPSTGQFFILNTPNVHDSSTWTLKTVTLNLPGGPNVNDVPVSEDYNGNGKADPAVYRPSSSTFFLINSATGAQQNIPFGTPGGSVAAAGPLLYRLTALKGSFATTDGYGAGVGGLPPGGGITASGGGGGGTVNAFAFHGSQNASASGSTTGSSTSSANSAAFSTMIAVATPLPVTTAVSTPTPVPTLVTTTPTTPVNSGVAVGVATPKVTHSTVHHHVKATHHAAKTAVHHHEVTKKKAATPLKVETKAPAAKLATEHPKAKAVSTTARAARTEPAKFAVEALLLQKLVLAKKGHKKA